MKTVVDFDEDLEGLFKAAMADPSVTDEVPRKGTGQKRAAGRAEDPRGASSRPSAPAKKASPPGAETLPPRPANGAPPRSNAPAMRAPTQAFSEPSGVLKPPPARSLVGGETGAAVPAQPSLRTLGGGTGAAVPAQPSLRTLGGGTGAAVPAQPPSRSLAGQPGSGAAAPARGSPTPATPQRPAPSQSMAPRPAAGTPISRAATQALPPESQPWAAPSAPARAEPSALPSKTPAAPTPASSRPTLPPRRAEQPRTNLKLIDYAPDEPLVDHRGRAKPLYEPRTPRPKSWRPSRPARILLGLFPGTRVMAMESVKDGLPYVLLGLLALGPALFLAVRWSRTAAAVQALLMDERWLLAHAGLVLALLLVYEALRLAASLEERTNGLRAPRVAAAMALPSCAVLWMGPELVALWPQLVEAAWFAALILAVGGLAGAAWSALDGTLATPRALRRFRVAGAVVLAVLAVTAFATHAGRDLAALAGYARAAGFRALPELLAKLA